MSMVRKEIDRQYFISINDKITKDVKLLVSPSSFQVGIDKKPSTLKVIGETIAAGGLALSVGSYTSSQTIDNNTTIALVSGGGSIILPISPRDGHVVIVKDASGSAPINVSASGLTIDAGTSDTISVAYSSTSYLYYSGQWYIIN